MLGCDSEPKLSENPDTTLDDFRNFLNNNFSSVSESKKLFEMIGASDGAGFTGKDLDIEVYLFDTKKKTKEGLTRISDMVKAFDMLDLKMDCLDSGFFLICNSATSNEFKSKKLLSKF